MNFQRSSPNQSIKISPQNQVNALKISAIYNIATKLLQLLSNKGFRLTKWMSNSQIILDHLPTAQLEINI